MKKIVGKAVRILGPVIDLVMTVISIPAALILLFYRLVGSATLPLTSRVLKSIGVFPIRRHYYEPLFDSRELTHSLDSPRELPGIDFNLPGQLRLLGQLDRADEFRRFIEDETAGFSFNNGAFESGDAEFLFQLLRHLKPGKVIEIGSGMSTRVASRALALNGEESGTRPRHVCIEPYEQPWLESFPNIELVRSKIEDCDIDWEKELGPGDLLFIDSSHMIRPQGDVVHEYLDIIPRLASGVVIHVHDIFSPRDYLEQWVKDDVRFWNEQYLLEATLGNTVRYEVIAALNLLKHEHFDELKRICPYLETDREPGSIYFRVR